jgi:O-antigen ligase
VQAPFVRSNPWSALVIFGSLWLLVCSVWIGLTRRRSYQLLFTALVGNAFLLALLGVLQQLTDAKQIFWSYLPSNSAFIASFIYRNHAGPYLNLMVSLAAGLGFWHYQRSQRRHEQPGMAAVLVFLAVFVAIMVVFSYSRASIGVLLAFTFLILCSLMARRYFRQTGSSRSRKDLFLLVLVLGGFLSICLVSIRAEKVWQRFSQLSTEPAGTTGFRGFARQASADMFRDRWLFGWGAGCFRYGFPLYAQKYPDIYLSRNGGLLYWEHAHNDLLEFPIELGAVGLIPLVFIISLGVWYMVSLRFWRNAVALSLMLVCLLVACHAWIDFVFQSPAVLLTWSALLVTAVRWVELDRLRTLRPATRLPPPDRNLADNDNKTESSRRSPLGSAAFPRRSRRLNP